MKPLHKKWLEVANYLNQIVRYIDPYGLFYHLPTSVGSFYIPHCRTGLKRFAHPGAKYLPWVQINKNYIGMQLNYMKNIKKRQE